MNLENLVNSLAAIQKDHPYISSMVIAEMTFIAGDAIAQLIENKKVNKRKIFYTAILAPIYGLCAKGLMETGELVGKYISENPLVKGALGPNLWGNFFNTFFFVNNTVGKEKDYSIPELARNYRNLFPNEEDSNKDFWQRFKERYIDNIPKKEFAVTTAFTLTAWNGIQWLNYSQIPENLRTPACLLENAIWIPVLSWLSLRGNKKITKK